LRTGLAQQLSGSLRDGDDRDERGERPRITSSVVELQMQLAEEVVGEDLVEAEGVVSGCVKEMFGDLGENCLLGFVQIRLRRVIPEQCPRPRGEGLGFVRIEWCLAVAWRQRHQAD
jgi:hypothetical protein